MPSKPALKSRSASRSRLPPEPPIRTPGGDRLTDLVLAVFKLNGRFLDVAEEITADTRLTAARWQVLGAVLPGPLTVAAIGRHMGLSRQAVQRLADLLVEEGLCAYEDNPAHRRAKLLVPTPAGWAQIDRIRPIQIDWADRVAARVGEAKLMAALKGIRSVLEALEQPECAVHPAPDK